MSWVGGAWRIGRKESEEEEGSEWDGEREWVGLRRIVSMVEERLLLR